MNVQEFAALKPGDKITNPMTNSVGRVSRVGGTGIWLVWVVPGEPDSDANARFYGVQSTIWFHWDVLECAADNVPDTRADGPDA